MSLSFESVKQKKGDLTMAKKINKRQWKKEAKRNAFNLEKSSVETIYKKFCQFVAKIPEKYNTDPAFPETGGDYMLALDLFLEDEMPSLRNYDDTAQGRENLAAIHFIEKKIFELTGEDEDEISYPHGKISENLEVLTLGELRERDYAAYLSIAQ